MSITITVELRCDNCDEEFHSKHAATDVADLRTEARESGWLAGIEEKDHPGPKLDICPNCFIPE